MEKAAEEIKAADEKTDEIEEEVVDETLELMLELVSLEALKPLLLNLR